MTIFEILRSHPRSKVIFPDKSFSYYEIAEGLQSYTLTSETFLWSGQWHINNFIKLLTAFENECPVICSHRMEEIPLTKGKIAFKTSGTEGSSKWVIHSQSIFLEGPSVAIEDPAIAMLHPNHAAGFDFMFHCLRGGKTFGFNDLSNLDLISSPKTIFGPPQVLSYLLFFNSKYSHLLNSISAFYSCTDILSPAIVQKKKDFAYVFQLYQFYGSTETMLVWTQTHPDKPWLMKINDDQGRIVQNSLHFIGNTLAESYWSKNIGLTNFEVPFKLDDVFESDEDGWFHLKNNSRNITKIWGQTINLKSIENRLMALETIPEAKCEVLSLGPLGKQLKLHLWSESMFTIDELYHLIPELVPYKLYIQVVNHQINELKLEKKKC